MKTLLTITAVFALSLGDMAAQNPSKDPEYARLVDTAFVLLRKGDCGPYLDFYENAFRHSRYSALSHLVYGSQVVRDDDNGPWKLHPIEDEANVNKRGAEIGMEPLEAYALHFGIVYAQLALQTSENRNPIFPGWYADPEAAVFGKTYWVYPTYSAPYEQQVFLDAFSSTDLEHWEKHPRIIDTAAVKWAKKAMWAPAILKKGRKYYLFFSANDVHPGEVGGIGVAVAKRPEGPFKDHLGKPLIGEIHHGAQPIDQFVFMDKDGGYYMIYGGWGHCNMVRLNADFTGLAPFADGSFFKEITPKGYVEGPIMFQRRGKYYFMWSEGGWGGPDYRVAYAVSDSMFGPFERIGTVLQQDAAVATGAGHHSVIQAPGSDDWFIVYHRRPLGETDANHRVVCMDKMYFDEQGYIEQVKITN